MGGSDQRVSVGRKRVAGLIMGVRVIKTRRGRMAIVSIDDKTARAEVTVYREAFDKFLDKLIADRIVVIEGQCDVDEYSGNFSLQAEDIMTIDEARNRLARALVLRVDESLGSNDLVDDIQGVIGKHRQGECPIAVEYVRCDSRARLKLGEAWRVAVNDALIEDMRHCFGPEHVYLEY